MMNINIFIAQSELKIGMLISVHIEHMLIANI